MKHEEHRQAHGSPMLLDLEQAGCPGQLRVEIIVPDVNPVGRINHRSDDIYNHVRPQGDLRVEKFELLAIEFAAEITDDYEQSMRHAPDKNESHKQMYQK